MPSPLANGRNDNRNRPSTTPPTIAMTPWYGWMGENDRLRERIATLEDALKPFTLCVGMFAGCSDDLIYSDASEEYGDNAPPITVGHCRRAKEVLDGKHP